MLADGTTLNVAATVTATGTSGSMAVYAPLYGGKGFLSGVLKFETITTAGAETDLDGTLEWQKPVGKAGSNFAARFDTSIDAEGSIYKAPGQSPGTLIPASLTQASVTLSGGNFTSPQTDPLSLITSKLLREPAPGVDHATITIIPASGLFTGTFLDPLTHATVKLSGALLQTQSLGAGFFCTKHGSGTALLIP